MAKSDFSTPMAVAVYLREDVGDTTSRRYQPTRTPCAVYTVGNRYLTAARNGRKPRGDANYSWKRVPCPRAEAFGWTVWESI